MWEALREVLTSHSLKPDLIGARQLSIVGFLARDEHKHDRGTRRSLGPKPSR